MSGPTTETLMKKIKRNYLKPKKCVEDSAMLGYKLGA
jgi:hypothetical protein